MKNQSAKKRVRTVVENPTVLHPQREHYDPSLEDNGRAMLKGGALSVHFSSERDDWPTPKWLFESLDAEFGFTLDPCSSDANAKCPKHFTKEDDGLKQDWGTDAVFMNPPYGREIPKWMQKAWHSAQAGATVVCLIPSRTDTEWWHRYAMKGEIRLLKGRVRFEGAQSSAPFPSAVVVFRPAQFRLVSGVRGKATATAGDAA